jgi:anaerobic ribonucleoside-triphosphate reductase activating protein
MNYIKLVSQSTSNGPGIRVVLFVAGCRNWCPECHNPETWCFAAGKPFTPEVKLEILQLLSKPWISGLTLCGGEPMEPENQIGLIDLIAQVREQYPNKSIWCYTGYEWEDLNLGGRRNLPITKDFLSYLDVLIAGPYLKDVRDISNNNLYRGSMYQRVIDVQESLKKSTKILLSGIPNND